MSFHTRVALCAAIRVNLILSGSNYGMLYRLIATIGEYGILAVANLLHPIRDPLPPIYFIWKTRMLYSVL